MKKSLFALLLTCCALAGKSQCLTDSTILTFGFHPDTGSILRPACNFSKYEEVIQIYNPPNVVVQWGTFPVNYVQLDSIPNLPIGLYYATNPVNGKLSGGERGCIDLFGTVNAPDGLYPITVYYTANFNVGGSPFSLGFTSGYKIPVVSGSAVFSSVRDSICANSAYQLGGVWLTQPGIYRDTLASVSGCDSIISLDLSVIPFDTTITISVAGDTLYAPPGYENYIWYNCAIQAEVQSGTSPVLANPDNCCYRVTFTNSSCSHTSPCIAPGADDIRELRPALIRVYPNPATDRLSIENAGSEHLLFRISDLSGRLLQTIISRPGMTQLPIDNLTPGAYLLSDDRGQTYRFVKF